jgi:hypothetical protein
MAALVLPSILGAMVVEGERKQRRTVAANCGSGCRALQRILERGQTAELFRALRVDLPSRKESCVPANARLHESD